MPFKLPLLQKFPNCLAGDGGAKYQTTDSIFSGWNLIWMALFWKGERILKQLFEHLFVCKPVGFFRDMFSIGISIYRYHASRKLSQQTRESLIKSSGLRVARKLQSTKFRSKHCIHAKIKIEMARTNSAFFVWSLTVKTSRRRIDAIFPTVNA